ncbi:hypothetical protein [Lysobacter sp. TAB13]|uniref:hypothetical protein n=1 Tax=Lysobacter sp. TAB13 TaxID=3233065 RepID=UPI003F98CBC2
MKSLAMAMVAAAAMIAATGLAQAGEKSNVPVSISTNPQGQAVRAFGMLASARASAGVNQTIGCASSATGTTVVAACEARNAAGTYVQCTTYNAALVAVAQSVSADSYVDFSFDGSGNCTSLYVSNGSSNAVKQP